VADFDVVVTKEAEADLDEIADFIERHDSAESADYVCRRVKETILNLESSPQRGRIVPELKEVGLFLYREVLFKPYRILYFISGRRVYVHCIFDGRRSVESILSQRLLR
jgi:toxin ParE1/3/4